MTKYILFLLLILPCISFPGIVAGDANGDEAYNVGDRIDHIFKGGPPPVPIESIIADKIDSTHMTVKEFQYMFSSWVIYQETLELPQFPKYDFYIDSEGYLRFIERDSLQ